MLAFCPSIYARLIRARFMVTTRATIKLNGKAPKAIVAAANANAADVSAAERNKRLANRMQDALASNKAAYKRLKHETTLFRQGEVSAEALQQQFALAFQSQAPSLFLELAELLPSPQQRAQLLSAASRAGWALPDDATVDGGLREPDQENTASWQPLDRSRVQAAASALAEEQDLLLRADAVGATSAAEKQQSGMPSMSATGLELPPGVLDGEPRPAKRSRREKRAEEISGDAVSGNGVLYWIRQDYRLHDNPALCAAAAAAKRSGGKLTLVYVCSPDEDGDDVETGTSWRPGGACLIWIEAALASLDADLIARYGPGAKIVFRRGPYLSEVSAVAAAVGAGAVYYNRRYEPAMTAADARVERGLQEQGLEVKSYPGLLMREPQEVRIDMTGRWVGHFGTLSPFMRACERLPALPKPLPPPGSLPVADRAPAVPGSLPDAASLGMVQLPIRADGTVVDWGQQLRDAWNISEAAALACMEKFMSEGLATYEASRHLADARAVSLLSAYVHHGQLSPRLLMHETVRRGGRELSKTFSRRLIWRDLAYWQLHHWPHMACRPLRTHYSAQEWNDDPHALRAWQRGRTGFPLVDAGMRQLWRTGWMQQSIRMVCAAFLTEYLNINWVHGERWFHDTLVDGDLAINSMMWQNAGKSGLDQWNFTLLPTSTSQDPDGAYISRWVPELARLPRKYLHQPWLAPLDVLAAAGVDFGTGPGCYPQRISTAVPQELRRENAKKIAEARAKAPEWIDAGGYDMVVVPEGATVKQDGTKMRVFTKSDYRKLLSVA